jgi:hypothetical protein
MSPSGSIFLDFNLPNAATWFYFALLLGVALFFKFGRLFSVRNVDVLGMFLLVPGLLILHEAYSAGIAAKAFLGGISAFCPAAPLLPRWYWFGYLWLLVGSGLMLLRCLLDLALERRPALGPNLNFGGLAWLGSAMFVCLVAVTIRNPAGPAQQVGKRSAALAQTQLGAEELVESRLTGEAQPRGDVVFWVERGLAIAGHLAVVVALVLIGWRHFQDLETGMAAATLYLLLPYTAYHVAQIHHVLPAAALVWAVAVYRYPTVAGLLFGLAVASPYFPALLFPLWCGFYRGRGVGRFAAAFVVVAVVLWLTGDLRESLWLAISDWSSPSGDLVGFWSEMRWAWAYRLPVLVAYLAFALAVFFWPSPKNLAHLIALSAALLIGIQFWYADQGGVYVLWYLPLFILMSFRPTLADRRPPPTPEETEWLLRATRFVWGWVSPLVTGWLKPRKQPVRVPNGEG